MSLLILSQVYNDFINFIYNLFENQKFWHWKFLPFLCGVLESPHIFHILQILLISLRNYPDIGYFNGGGVSKSTRDSSKVIIGRISWRTFDALHKWIERSEFTIWKLTDLRQIPHERNPLLMHTLCHFYSQEWTRRKFTLREWPWRWSVSYL